eukprot:2374762-Alexandrium_andersonii.AAC.1
MLVLAKLGESLNTRVHAHACMRAHPEDPIFQIEQGGREGFIHRVSRRVGKAIMKGLSLIHI